MRIVLLIGAMIAVLTGCGDSGNENDQENGSAAVQRGQELYDENCRDCHGGEDGGEISDSPPPHNENGHTWHHPDCLLTEITLKGPAAYGGASGPGSMPAFEGKLSEEDVAAILDYLRTWWTDEQRAYQAEITATQCEG